MSFFMWNLLMALIWATMTGAFNLPNVAIGFLMGYGLLWFAQPAIGRSAYFGKFWGALSLAAFFVWELLISNVRMVINTVMPLNRLKPGVVAVPLAAKTDAEISLLANLITMTPGSFSIDVSHDRQFLYIHTVFVEDVEVFRRNIKEGFERRLLEVMR